MIHLEVFADKERQLPRVFVDKRLAHRFKQRAAVGNLVGVAFDDGVVPLDGALKGESGVLS